MVFGVEREEPMNFDLLRPEENVFHPRVGFGVVQGLTTRDLGGEATDYYDIRLAQGGVFSVPVQRAAAVGLRRIVNSIEDIRNCLRSPAAPLPINTRQRLTELSARAHAPCAEAMPEAVRDLLGSAAERRLTPAEKKWLDEAIERLAMEASLVEKTDVATARMMILHEIEELRPA
jgi:RNA polymerase-interacting CarD/CdnL/TRCF family regulator